MKVILITILLSYTLLITAQQNTTFTIEGMTCESCAKTATKALLEISGVDSVVVDFKTKLALIVGVVNEDDILNAMRSKTNFEVLFKGDSLLKPLSEKDKQELDIKTIKGGAKIKFKNHLVSGKITVFDFYADWCGPCRVFSPKVEHFIKENPDVSLRKVDIVNWQSALSKQLTKDYKMPALPFILVFDDKGKLLGKVEGNHIEKVEKIVSNKSK